MWDNARGVEASSRKESAELEDVGIEGSNLFWSFGLYAKFFICLVLLFLIYYLVKFMLNRFPRLQWFETVLRRKLFYSSVIRFMIESNLKITHNSIFFLYLRGSFASNNDTASTCFTIFVLVIIILWPPYLAQFLIRTRDDHEKQGFIRKFSSMYLTNKTDRYLGDGIRTNKARCFLYHVWFCIRRLSFVMCIFITRNNANQLQCLYGILII